MKTCVGPIEPVESQHGVPNDSIDQELEYLWSDSDLAGRSYDLYLGRISRSPVVRSRATGSYFMLPWSRIIALAEERGINGK